MKTRWMRGGARLLRHTPLLLPLLLTACPPPEPPAAAKAPSSKAQPATAAANPTGAKAPKIQVAEAKFDAGKVPQGNKVSHVFNLRNVGTDVLHIKRAKGS